VAGDKPSIIDRALSLQLKRSIIDPCRRITRHRNFVVVVDGLDKGGDDDIQQEMSCAFGYINVSFIKDTFLSAFFFHQQA
jgi:hypothetical protein